MADWTKRNFDDIRDRSPAEVPMRWLFSRNEVRSGQVGVSRFSYEPGARMPFGHRHGVQQEVCVVVAGCGRAKLDDQIVELRVGTCCASHPRSSGPSRRGRRSGADLCRRPAPQGRRQRALTTSGSTRAGG